MKNKPTGGKCGGEMIPENARMALDEKLHGQILELDIELYGTTPLGYSPDRAETVRAMKALIEKGRQWNQLLELELANQRLLNEAIKAELNELNES